MARSSDSLNDSLRSAITAMQEAGGEDLWGLERMQAKCSENLAHLTDAVTQVLEKQDTQSDKGQQQNTPSDKGQQQDTPSDKGQQGDSAAGPCKKPSDWKHLAKDVGTTPALPKSKFKAGPPAKARPLGPLTVKPEVETQMATKIMAKKTPPCKKPAFETQMTSPQSMPAKKPDRCSDPGRHVVSG
jgi:hypothetical protein